MSPHDRVMLIVAGMAACAVAWVTPALIGAWIADRRAASRCDPTRRAARSARHARRARRGPGRDEPHGGAVASRPGISVGSVEPEGRGP